MNNDLAPIIQTGRKPTAGDRIRSIANQLRQESDVQMKLTARILGAAAQISQNHDHLINEVVEMVEEDLNQQLQPNLSEPYTVEQLKKQFKTFKDARAYFGLKVVSWIDLASKLNEQPISAAPLISSSENTVSQRLAAIEQEIQMMRGEINQLLKRLETRLPPFPQR